jgi:hypothetical protein
MKIIKTNGKKANKKIHLLADVVMETSVNNSWLLNDLNKKEILLSLENSPWKSEELEDMCRECLNHTLSTHFALDTWYSGYYGDFDLDFDSLHDYFFYWGSQR